MLRTAERPHSTTPARSNAGIANATMILTRAPHSRESSRIQESPMQVILAHAPQSVEPVLRTARWTTRVLAVQVVTVTNGWLNLLLNRSQVFVYEGRSQAAASSDKTFDSTLKGICCKFSAIGYVEIGTCKVAVFNKVCYSSHSYWLLLLPYLYLFTPPILFI